MAKYKLFIDETRSYRHVVEIETELNENQLDDLLIEKIDKEDFYNISDVKYALVDSGLKVTKVVLDNEGDLGEIEIEEMEEIE